jgi:hypothetical protein
MVATLLQRNFKHNFDYKLVTFVTSVRHRRDVSQVPSWRQSGTTVTAAWHIWVLDLLRAKNNQLIDIAQTRLAIGFSIIVNHCQSFNQIGFTIIKRITMIAINFPSDVLPKKTNPTLLLLLLLLLLLQLLQLLLLLLILIIIIIIKLRWVSKRWKSQKDKKKKRIQRRRWGEDRNRRTIRWWWL